MKNSQHSRALLPRVIRLLVMSLAASLCLAACSQAVLAQGDAVTPNANLETTGIPKVPAALAQAVKQYSSPYGLPLAGWDPVKREIRLKGLSNPTWIARVDAPGGKQEPITYLQGGGIYDVYYQPQAKYLVYNRDTNGNEVFQFFLYDIAARKSTPLTDGKSRDTEPVWSNAGDQIVYSSSPAGGAGVSLYVINPLDLKSDRLLVNSTGSYLKAYDWSPDDGQVAFCDFASNRASTLWLLDMKTGAKTLASPPEEKGGAYYVDPQFGKDGKGLYVITDRNAEVRQLAYLDLTTKRMNPLTGEIKFDVDEFQIAPDGKTIAGIHRPTAI